MNFFGYGSFDAWQKRPLVEIYFFYQRRKRSLTLLVAPQKKRRPLTHVIYDKQKVL
jgi:hypothetical protein